MTVNFSESIKDRDVKFLHNIYPNLQFVLSKYGIDIFNSLGNYVLFGNVVISVIFYRFLLITFSWNGNFWFWWFHWNDRFQIYQHTSYFNWKKYFFIYKSSFYVKKLNIWGFCLVFFFLEILPTFSDFKNSNDCITKIRSKSIRLQPVFYSKLDLKLT